MVEDQTTVGIDDRDGQLRVAFAFVESTASLYLPMLNS